MLKSNWDGPKVFGSKTWDLREILKHKFVYKIYEYFLWKEDKMEHISPADFSKIHYEPEHYVFLKYFYEFFLKLSKHFRKIFSIFYQDILKIFPELDSLR